MVFIRQPFSGFHHTLVTESTNLYFIGVSLAMLSQVSVMGPTMFLIYINDMSLGLSKSIADLQMTPPYRYTANVLRS